MSEAVDRQREGSEVHGSDAEGASVRPLREDLAALRLPRDAGGDRAPGTRRWGGRPLRWALLGVVLVLAGVALWRLLAAGTLVVEVVRAEPFAEAARRPIPVLSGSGYLVPAQPFIAIGSRISGRIERYLVEEGDRVSRGDPLVQLDAGPYGAVVDQLTAALASSRARASLAESELRRAKQLFADGVASRDALDRKESEARVARASVEELDASLERARIDFQDTVIRAPTDGVVLEIFKQPGEVAVPGGFSGSGDLLRLANLDEIRAELDVNEADLPRVALDQAAEVIPDAFPDAHYAARVVKLAPQIDRQKGTRKVAVRVLAPDARLLPDMSVRVTFLTELHADRSAGADALPSAVVPRAALRRDADGRSFVWVVEDGRARRASVEVADTLRERVVLRGGLRGGEQVVVGSAPERDGQRVEIASSADSAER
ncbi:MAG: efflux RND transporter periplasmic adaptor subunit [Myxococcales bacterium]|nr:efflux RND transporter periplasmic adaptor subunit [Myxococcales bacterium]MDH5307702.1 efflux RND transporter periplasmic adaptor subunit [Myxococcales bacterium]MDH5565651.1 efflux RND transporter periplasmic adaptor subunit [Myxococcales bacterium]